MEYATALSLFLVESCPEECARLAESRDVEALILAASQQQSSARLAGVKALSVLLSLVPSKACPQLRAARGVQVVVQALGEARTSSPSSFPSAVSAPTLVCSFSLPALPQPTAFPSPRPFHFSTPLVHLPHQERLSPAM